MKDDSLFHLINGRGMLLVVKSRDENGKSMDMVDTNSKLVLDHPGPLLAHTDKSFLSLSHADPSDIKMQAGPYAQRDHHPEDHHGGPVQPPPPPLPSHLIPHPFHNHHSKQTLTSKHKTQQRINTTSISSANHFHSSKGGGEASVGLKRREFGHSITGPKEDWKTKHSTSHCRDD